MASIFISYRRDDASGHAGRICDRLTTRFGGDRVFMDVEDIQPGQQFVRSIEETIGRCAVVVAVIGPRWLEMLDERTQDADDFVRHEIGSALARNITVIPVLVGGAAMPQADRLPADLSELSHRQAVEIRDARFDDDVARLAKGLQVLPALAADEAQTHSRLFPGALRWAIPLVLVVAIVGAFLASRQADPALSLDDPATSAADPATSATDPATRPVDLATRQTDPTTRPADPATRQADPTPTRADSAPRQADPAPRQADPVIAGVWVAEMQDSQQRPFRIRLRFVQTGIQIAGVVEYPTGTGAIHDAKLDGRQLAFSTTHTPQFASEPATIRFQAEVNGDEIRLTLSDQASIATGIARRTAPQ